MPQILARIRAVYFGWAVLASIRVLRQILPLHSEILQKNQIFFLKFWAKICPEFWPEFWASSRCQHFAQNYYVTRIIFRYQNLKVARVAANFLPLYYSGLLTGITDFGNEASTTP